MIFCFWRETSKGIRNCSEEGEQNSDNFPGKGTGSIHHDQQQTVGGVNRIDAFFSWL
jgi:hypothetical protein